MAESGIDYVKYGCNAISGCTPISPGCQNCWAKVMAKRMAGRFGYPADDPFRPTMHPERLDDLLRMKGPGANAFGFMGDLFHDAFPFQYIANCYGAMHTAKHLLHLVLTKRPKRAVEFFRWFKGEWLGENQGWPSAFPEEYPHVMLGVTVENADYLWRMDEARKIPGRRWVSFEPLLGRIRKVDLSGFDWCVVGGESGPKARPMHPDWVRELRDQAVAQGVPFNFKQWGSWVPWATRAGYVAGSLMPGCDEYIGGDCGGPAALSHYETKNGRQTCIASWRDGLKKRVEAVTIDSHRWGKENLLRMTYLRAGKKLAGRLLDGQLWDQMPH